MSKIAGLSTYVPLFSGMYKGILSLILGLILIFDPDKSAPKLTYIMGMFWASSGIALLRHGPIGKMGKRLSKLISAVAIVTGLLVVARYFLNAVFGLQFVANTCCQYCAGSRDPTDGHFSPDHGMEIWLYFRPAHSSLLFWLYLKCCLACS